MRLCQIIFASACCAQWARVNQYYGPALQKAHIVGTGTPETILPLVATTTTLTIIFILARSGVSWYHGQNGNSWDQHRSDSRFWWVVLIDLVLFAFWTAAMVLGFLSVYVNDFEQITLVTGGIQPTMIVAAAWLGLPNAVLWALTTTIEAYRWFEFDKGF